LELRAPAIMLTYTLIANWVMKSVGNIVFGLLSERWGRLPIFFLGSALFSVCALGCSSAPSVAWLIALRSFQGFGEACGDLSVAVIRDVCADRSERIRMNSIRWSLRFLVPTSACSLGGPLAAFLGWRNFMVILAAWGCCNNIATAWLLQETRHPSTVSHSSPGSFSGGSSIGAGLLGMLRLLCSPLPGSCMLMGVLLFSLIYSTLGSVANIFEVFFQLNAGVVAMLMTSIPLASLFFPVVLIGQLGKDKPPLQTLQFGMFVQLAALCLALVFGYYSPVIVDLPCHAACLLVAWLMMTAVGVMVVPLEILFLDFFGHMAGLAIGLQAMLNTVLGSLVAVFMVQFVEDFHTSGLFWSSALLMAVCQVVFWGVLLRWHVDPSMVKGMSHEETFEDAAVQVDPSKRNFEATTASSIKD